MTSWVVLVSIYLSVHGRKIILNYSRSFAYQICNDVELLSKQAHCSLKHGNLVWIPLVYKYKAH